MVIRRRKRKKREYKSTKVDGFRCVIANKCNYDHLYTDLDHVKPFGNGGSNKPHNLMPLCRKHHTEKHQIGIGKMSEKYPNFLGWLIDKGWKRNAIPTASRKYKPIYIWSHEKEFRNEK